MPKLDFKCSVPVPVAELFAWHERQGAFERLAPPWEKLRIIRQLGGIRDGQLIFEIDKGIFSFDWDARHSNYVADEQFTDEQVSGPFESWRHVHRFRPTSDTTSELHDAIDYTLPFAPLTTLPIGWYVRRQINRMFRFRHRRTREDMTRHWAFRAKPRLKVLITGASGLVGKSLSAFLTTGGHSVEVLTRSQAASDAGEGIFWDPMKGSIDMHRLEGFDAVVHLAGENIAGRRWSPAVKDAIRLSRVNGTSLLSTALGRLKSPPKVLISASAIGYYGNRSDTPIWETSEPGEGFLPDTCREWEAATARARAVGVRVVNLRIGMVLSPAGGALARMIPPFLAGVGGVIGSGKQYMSWITLNDLVGVIHACLFDPNLMGAVNAVSPKPVTNREFTATLAKVLHRPALIPVPEAAINLLFGEMGKTLITQGARVLPRRLSESRFEFCSNDLEDGLRCELGL